MDGEQAGVRGLHDGEDGGRTAVRGEGRAERAHRVRAERAHRVRAERAPPGDLQLGGGAGVPADGTEREPRPHTVLLLTDA
ncbi:hypothetical protein ABT173_06565 [Streptomyces sp. NPDC001795]|uniref:hypothetical protein n=1 Tax=Streptomyces sp. NPDC001795 TaxID=3154525 RepID=UPI00332CD35D